MKKLLGFVSVSLWAAALVFAPAPAEATFTKYPSNVDYLACAQYGASSDQCWSDTYEDYIYFYGMMYNTIPISACAGSCNGTQNLIVEFDIGNGRKGMYRDGQCGNNLLYWVSPCTTCSG